MTRRPKGGRVRPAQLREGETMKLRQRNLVILISLGLLIAGAWLPHPAKAMSAFALGLPRNVVEGGVTDGVAYNYTTRKAAEERALKRCREDSQAAPTTVALCKIVAHFDKQCLAVSMDPGAGTAGYGWAVAATANAANAQALQNCRQAAGLKRASNCGVLVTGCDTMNMQQ